MPLVVSEEPDRDRAREIAERARSCAASSARPSTAPPTPAPTTATRRGCASSRTARAFLGDVELRGAVAALERLAATVAVPAEAGAAAVDAFLVSADERAWAA